MQQWDRYHVSQNVFLVSSYYLLVCLSLGGLKRCKRLVSYRLVACLKARAAVRMEGRFEWVWVIYRDKCEAVRRDYVGLTGGVVH